MKPSLKRLDTIDSKPASPEDPGITLGAAAVTVIANGGTQAPKIPQDSPTTAINLDAPKITIENDEFCFVAHKQKPFVGDLQLPNNGVVLDPTEMENPTSSYTNLGYAPSITDLQQQQQ